MPDGDDLEVAGATVVGSPAESSDGNLWATIAPDWLQNNARTLQEFVESPKSFVVGLMLAWLVNNLILRPIGWGIAFVDWAFTTSADALGFSLTSTYQSVAGSLEESLLTVPRTIEGVVLSVATDTGLAAPIVTAAVGVTIGVILATVVYVLARVIIDAIPGGGGLLR